MNAKGRDPEVIYVFIFCLHCSSFYWSLNSGKKRRSFGSKGRKNDHLVRSKSYEQIYQVKCKCLQQDEKKKMTVVKNVIEVLHKSLKLVHLLMWLLRSEVDYEKN